jgi:hypothetical protein
MHSSSAIAFETLDEKIAKIAGGSLEVLPTKL